MGSVYKRSERKELTMRKQSNKHDTSGSGRQWLDVATVATLAVLCVAGASTVLLLSITAILLGVGHQFGFL